MLKLSVQFIGSSVVVVFQRASSHAKTLTNPIMICATLTICANAFNVKTNLEAPHTHTKKSHL